MPCGIAFLLPGFFPAGSPAGLPGTDSQRGRDRVSWPKKQPTEKAKPSPALRLLRHIFLIVLEPAENGVFLPCQILPSGQTVQSAQTVVNRWTVRIVQRRLPQIANGVVDSPQFLRRSRRI